MEQAQANSALAVFSAICHSIMACADVAQLDSWLLRAITATTIEDVIGA